MKTLIILSFIVCTSAFAETSTAKNKKEVKMDDGDKQLLARDVCRKPIEYLETKYSHIPVKELIKMKEKCDY